MHFSFKIFYLLVIGFFLNERCDAQQKTYCNPINIDYGFTPIPNFSQWGKHRATADPVIVNYKGDYYLFSTNQWGYWWSSDMLKWNFVSKKFLRPWNEGYDELCAPAVGIVGDTMIVIGSTYTNKFTLWMSTNPKDNNWKPIVDSFEIGGWDPSFFTDDDGKLYMYNGSSNVFPLYGVELDRKSFKPIGTRREMHSLKPWRYGWQRFGEHMDNTFLDPFMEGAWITKHNKKYYLQYGAPGTEFSGYADGVAVSDKPLGEPFGNFIEQSDPLSMKLGGFARGAGHGATFKDNQENFWHVSTIMLSVKNNFERRVGIWPAGFDKDDMMWCSTSFGDYPHYLPAFRENDASPVQSNPSFTGWMLLNYNKPVLVSSTLGAFSSNNAVDENMKTYWSAESNQKGEWIQSDLGKIATVRAIQINYADQDVEYLGKQTNIYHQYIIYTSLDGKTWDILIDKSKNKTDIPHEYIELDKPIQSRFIKMENIHMASGKFAISGLRVFGNGNGYKPTPVSQFLVLRTEKDKRSAWIRWSSMDNAFAYNIYYGTDPDKLYNSIMVYGANEYWFKGMDLKKTYYYTIEAINENGVSEKYKTIKVE
ncbi:MAG: coagulation factor 5/8 type domain protein [Chitinophagaceae bacterium]|nr:MAG: coagulation factor 5/8 type domain protein [Chitinophagaceae bacterium]